MKFLFLVLFSSFQVFTIRAQDKKIDTIPQHPLPIPADTILRIINLNPYFTIHVDSLLNYDLRINKNPENCYWYLKQAHLQLVHLPSVEFDEKLSQEEADKYFNDPKVIKKYKLKVN